MKKFMNALVALVTTLAMAVAGFVGISSAYAGDEPATKYTITIDTQEAGHTYVAYQIFTGDLSDGVLSNIKWGNGVTDLGKAAIAAAVGVTGTTVDGVTTYDPVKVAEALAKAENDSTTAKKVAAVLAVAANVDARYGVTATMNATWYDAEGNEVAADAEGAKPDVTDYTITGLTAGYYGVSDQGSDLANKDDAFTSVILRVVNSVTVQPKSETPSVTKKVWDDKDTTDAEDAVAGWYDSADHDINEVFDFKLEATIPADNDRVDYDEYALIFNDTMSAGISFDYTKSIVVSYDQTEVSLGTFDAEAKTFTTEQGVVVDSASNPMTVTIENVRNFIETPDGNGGYTTTNITKAITVTVIYAAHLNENAYVNTTSGETTNKNTVNLQYSNNPYVKGDYGKTPDTTVYVYTYGIDVNKTFSADPSLTDLPEFTLYKDSADDENNKVGDAVEVVATAHYTVNGADATQEEYEAADEDARAVTYTYAANFEGLDAGTYVLKETKTPKGFNTADNVTVVITATHTVEAVDLSASTVKGDAIGVTGALGVDILNQKGSTLPSTGGMGTTILYVVGGLVVLAAAIGMAIAMRRRNAA